MANCSMKSSSQWRSYVGIFVLALVSSLPCCAAQVAVLRNGFSIRHERKQVIGSTTRLYVTLDGSSYVDVPTAEIEHFEDAPAENAPLANPASGVRFQSAASKSAPRMNLNEVVNTASDRYRLDPDLVNSVIKAESGFNVRAVSPKGAQGLMQLMPETASQLGVPNAFDPRANVEGGTRYLRELLEHYNFDLIKALAAYNAGPRRVEEYGGVPPYYETRAYVARIVRDFNKKKIAQKSAAQAATKKTPAPTNSGQAVKVKPANAHAKDQAKTSSAQTSE
jgi:soluble lytic murein transglycosylase-like protein